MENMVILHSAFFSDPFNISLTSLSIACILLLAMPFFLTVLTKHQAFAPSSEILLPFKSRFFRVEFSLRCSAKAFESSSWIHQILGPLSPPFLLENLSACWTVGFCMKYGFGNGVLMTLTIDTQQQLDNILIRYDISMSSVLYNVYNGNWSVYVWYACYDSNNPSTYKLAKNCLLTFVTSSLAEFDQK